MSCSNHTGTWTDPPLRLQAPTDHQQTQLAIKKINF
jgi:hypothetical protein